MHYSQVSLNESMTIGRELDPEHAYELFAKSYEKETGSCWSKDKFLDRARSWSFFGDENGFVAVRKQYSGPMKLVGVAGDPRSVVKGLTELEATGAPIWGAVSEKLCLIAKKRGMIVPHTFPGGPFFIRTLVATIPESVFGGIRPEVAKDGGIVFDYPDVGRAVKYLIGNKAYFMSAVKLPHIAEKIAQIPGLKMVLKLMGIS